MTAHAVQGSPRSAVIAWIKMAVWHLSGAARAYAKNQPTRMFPPLPSTLTNRPTASFLPRSAEPVISARLTEFPAPRLELYLPVDANLSDEALAGRALQALFWSALLLQEHIQVTVADGRITLSGEVLSWADRAAAEQVVARLQGVRAVTNLIAVQPWAGSGVSGTGGTAEAYGRDAESGSIPGRIEALYARRTGLGATEIRISAVGGKVVLRGQVSASRDRDLANRVAWAAPGVTEVLDQLTVGCDKLALYEAI